jgi:hypothetical protein
MLLIWISFTNLYTWRGRRLFIFHDKVSLTTPPLVLPNYLELLMISLISPNWIPVFNQLSGHDYVAIRLPIRTWGIPPSILIWEESGSSKLSETTSIHVCFMNLLPLRSSPPGDFNLDVLNYGRLRMQPRDWGKTLFHKGLMSECHALQWMMWINQMIASEKVWSIKYISTGARERTSVELNTQHLTLSKLHLFNWILLTPNLFFLCSHL